jgi:hypothetical protein
MHRWKLAVALETTQGLWHARWRIYDVIIIYHFRIRALFQCSRMQGSSRNVLRLQTPSTRVSPRRKRRTCCRGMMQRWRRSLRSWLHARA